MTSTLPRPAPPGYFRIAVMGSSATWGEGIQREEAWPAALQARLLADGHRAWVWNFAQPAMPVDAYLERMLLIQDHLAPQAWIVQLPHYARQLIGVNGCKRQPEPPLSPGAIFGREVSENRLEYEPPTRMRIFSAMARPDSPVAAFMESHYLPRLRTNNQDLTMDEVMRFLRFWEDNVIRAHVAHMHHGKEIALLQRHLAGAGLPYCMFDWINYNSATDERMGPIKRLVDLDTYVGGGREIVFEFLERRWGGPAGAWKKDSWGHVVPEGHRLIADEFLYPHVVERLLPAR